MDKSLLYIILRNTLLFTAAVLITGGILFSTLLKPYYLPFSLFLLFLFFTVTILYTLLLVRAAKKNPKRFVAWFMGVTTLKFMVYFMVMVFYLLFHREQAIPFLLTFLILYFSYTAFAIIQTLKAVNISKTEK